MKRFAVLVAMLVPLSLFAAGCGGTGSSSGSKGTEPKAEMKKQMQADMDKMASKMKK